MITVIASVITLITAQPDFHQVTRLSLTNVYVSCDRCPFICGKVEKEYINVFLFLLIVFNTKRNSHCNQMKLAFMIRVIAPVITLITAQPDFHQVTRLSLTNVSVSCDCCPYDMWESRKRIHKYISILPPCLLHKEQRLN